MISLGATSLACPDAHLLPIFSPFLDSSDRMDQSGPGTRLVEGVACGFLIGSTGTIRGLVSVVIGAASRAPQTSCF